VASAASGTASITEITVGMATLSRLSGSFDAPLAVRDGHRGESYAHPVDLAKLGRL